MSWWLNYAAGNARFRRGQDKFSSKSFYDLANQLIGQYQAFSTWLSYDDEFYEFVKTEIKRGEKVIKPEWACKGWSGETPATFVDFPIDFDAKEDLYRAFDDCRRFVQNELLDKGISERYFVIYLSGGKGFHLHVSASCLDVQLPVEHAGYRMKALVSKWHERYPTIDLSVYNSTAFIRLPGSRHKSGLYKTEIAWNDFNLDHINNMHAWASRQPEAIRIPDQTPPPVCFELPAYEQKVLQYSYDAVTSFDPEARITPNCKWLQKVLADPSNNGNDGLGREKRRNAIGILLSVHESSEHNPELQWYISELARHPYMADDEKLIDIAKWIREYDRDGEIKCKKTCYSVGCSSVQRKICGTRSPIDWKLKKRDLILTPIDVARATIRRDIEGVLEQDGNGIYVVDYPVGSGKTYSLIRLLQEHDLTAFYIAQTHKLALQTHSDFLAQGLESRHVASRTYLKDEEAFACLFESEVAMAIQNGYGSHTICSTCPRKRKKQVDTSGLEPDEDYDPCEYWEQFEGLKDVDVVVGVHNHLFDFIYEKANVAERSVTIIDESPMEAFGRTISPVPSEKLKVIRQAFIDEIKSLESGEVPDNLPTPEGLFGRVAQLVEQDIARLEADQANDRLGHFKLFQDIFQGRMFDFISVGRMKHEQLRAIWYDVAQRLALRSGLAAAEGLPLEKAHLCIPFVVLPALELAGRNIVYDPEGTSYLPIELPPNKIIILDATASNDAYAQVITELTRGGPERTYQFISHPLIEQPYSHVVQVTSSSYGVAALCNPETQSYIYSVIKALMQKHIGKSLIICHKQHKEFWTTKFKSQPEVHVATYGSLKGLNHWNDCVAQYVVGTPFIPDSGIRDLAAKLGCSVDLDTLMKSAALKRLMLLARNGDTAIISRRFYNGYPFHTALAQMRSQWEVTQAVRLRLYDNTTEHKQHLYLFSNVELKGMYADEYKTLTELAYEATKPAEGQRRELEVKGAAYEEITEWFEQWPKGHVFVKNNIPMFSGDRYIQFWLQAAIDAGWIERLGKQRKYIKL